MCNIYIVLLLNLVCPGVNDHLASSIVKFIDVPFTNHSLKQ